MSRVVVGRIFWKELRTQRSLWLGVLCLAVGIQVLFTVLAISGQGHVFDVQQSVACVFLAAYLGATVYAIASGAASFTEENETRTAVFLRTVPMTPAEAFAGKWAYGMASTGLLMLVLGAAGATCATIMWNQVQPNGALALWLESAHDTPALSAPGIAALVWSGLAIPVVTFGVCSFCSLVFTDGMLAAISGLFGTIAAVGAAFAVAHGALPDFARAIWFIAIWLMVTDYGLTGFWLRGGGDVRGAGRFGSARARRQFWSWLIKSRFDSLQLLRLGEPVAPWRRAMQRLIWKECRQAWPFVKINGLIGLVAIAISLPLPELRFFGIYAPWIAVLAAPLIMGVGAYYADHKGRACRMLGDRGVPADGAWIIKHTTWILHAIVTCGIIAYADDLLWQYRPDKAFGVQQSVAETIRLVFSAGPYQVDSYQLDPHTYSSHPDYFDTAAILRKAIQFALLYMLLAYSIAQRFSFSFAKGPLAFTMATGTTVAACLIWYLFAYCGVPIGWTIGLIPIALLAYTAAHSGNWQIQKTGTERWYWATAWFLAPFAGIAVAAYLYWPRITVAVWRYSPHIWRL